MTTRLIRTLLCYGYVALLATSFMVSTSFAQPVEPPVTYGDPTELTGIVKLINGQTLPIHIKLNYVGQAPNSSEEKSYLPFPDPQLKPDNPAHFVNSLSLLDDDMPIAVTTIFGLFDGFPAYHLLSRDNLLGFEIHLHFTSDHCTATPCFGPMYSASTGLIGDLRVRRQASPVPKAKSRTDGRWRGACSDTSTTVPTEPDFPAELTIIDTHRPTQNPPEFDLPNSPGKIGTLKIRGYDYPLSSCTIDYFSLTLHCTYSNATENTKLVFDGDLSKEDSMSATLESSIKGKFAACDLKRVVEGPAQKQHVAK